MFMNVFSFIIKKILPMVIGISIVAGSIYIAYIFIMNI